MPRYSLFALLLAMPSWSQQYRAFWSDVFHEGFKTPAQVDQLLDNVIQARANAIFMQARRRADSYYRQSLEPFAEDAQVPPGFDPLEDLIAKAHARSIEVHAWFVVYPLWRAGAAPADPRHLYHLHGPGAPLEQRWLNVSSAGIESLNLDPGHPEVLPYLIDTFLEPLKRYDLDGIHLDYIRYPEGASYGYNAAALARFARQSNRGEGDMPAPKDAAWSQWRRDQVTALVRQLYLRVQELRPSVKVSAASITWGNGPLNDAEFRSKDAYSAVFQDWRGWLEEGILDLAMPMNYFREATAAAFLSRWSEFQKDRQYNRGYVNGLGNYLNTLPQSLAQVERVLSPSANGNLPLGLCFYSYSATRSDAPERPNPEFYQAVGDYFRTPAAVPDLPWKSRPTRGHLMGSVAIDGGQAWWRDGLAVRVTAPSIQFERTIRTDAAGFFGLVDLAPAEYSIEVVSNGRTLFTGGPQAVQPGRVAGFPVVLGTEDFAAALPALSAAGRTHAAPGEMIRLTGRRLASFYDYARAVPLPTELAGSVVVVNGIIAPLLEIGEDFVEFQLPYTEAAQWWITLRRAGADSAPVVLEAVPAAPVIRELRRDGDVLDLSATGLGRTEPPASAGMGAEEFAQPTVLPVKVQLLDDAGAVDLRPEFAGLAAYQPGRYLVRVLLPPGRAAGRLRLQVGDVFSPPVVY